MQDDKPLVRFSVSDAHKNKKITLIFIVILLLFFLIIILLNYFNILRLNRFFDFFSILPHREIIMDYRKTKGNPFKEPVRLGNSNMTLRVIEGIVVKVSTERDNSGVLLYITKTDGSFVKEPYFVPKDIKPLLVTINDESAEEVGIDDIRKNDYVMISYNENIDTKKGFVGGIRINRRPD